MLKRKCCICRTYFLNFVHSRSLKSNFLSLRSLRTVSWSLELFISATF